MTTYRVVFSPEADDQFTTLYRYIAEQSSPAGAKRFTDAILDRCAALADMPRQGTPRDAIRKGLPTLAFRRRFVIAYAVVDRTVTVLGIFYGGQDFETLLQDESE